MKSNWTKLAAAGAGIIAVSVLAVTFWTTSSGSAYAIEQTMEANQRLRYIHVKNVSPPAYEPQDMWLEFDEEGGLHRLRVEEGRGETFRIMVWADHTLKWWSPPKKELVILNEPRVKNEVDSLRERVDPRYAVNSLYEAQRQGRVDITVDEPGTDDLPITLTATETTPLDELPPHQQRVRYVLLIDPQTKLVTRRDVYSLVDGEYGLRRRQVYLDYNKPIPPEMFVLQPPEDTKVEDRSVGIGMPQGDLSDAEAAAEVVREYLRALIARDYEKAGNLYNGRPGDKLRRWVEEKLKTRYVRIISVGPAVPASDRGLRSFRVPFTFEIEKDGVKKIVGPPVESGPGPLSHRQATVGPVANQPDRWVIYGGI